MQQLTPKQQKKVERYAKMKLDKDTATLEMVSDLEEKLDNIEGKIDSANTFAGEKLSTLQEELKKKLESELVLEIDRQELKGDKGERGEDGKDGKNGKDGLNGKDGKDGADGLDGLNGKDGIDGKDGSPDTGEEIITKINDAESLINPEKVKGLAKDIKELKAKPPQIIETRIEQGGGGSGLERVNNKQGVHQIDFGAGLSVTNTVNGVKVEASGTSTDEKVKYDVNDLTAGYLADKIVAGTGITLSEGTGADENKLKITNSLDLSAYLTKDQTTPQTTVGNFSFPSVSVTAGNMNQYSPLLFGTFSNTTGYIPIWNGAGGFDSNSGLYYSTALREFQTPSIYSSDGVTSVFLNDGTYAINATGKSYLNGAATLGSLSVTNGAVINEVGGDYDFRVEGDTKTHLLFTDASTDRVGINSSTPAYNLDMVNDDAADAGIAVRASTYINIPFPGSLTNLALLSPRGFNFCTDGYTLAAAFQPSLGIGLAGNRGPMLGIKASATGAAIAIEQGRIGVGTSGPQEPIDCIGNILTRSTSGTAYETRTRMVSTYYGAANNYASGGLEIDGVQAGVGYGLFGATRFYAGANTDATRGWAWKADGLLGVTTLAASGAQMVLNKAGNLGIGTVAPTAYLHLKAGTTTAGTAPIKLTTGNYNTTPEAGTFEWYATTAENPTFTPVSTRYRIPLVDSGVGGLTSGRVPFATTNGRLTDDSDMTFATDTLTVTKIKSSHYCADGTAPLANGTYTIFDGSYTGAVNGTITIKDGLITAYQAGGAPLA
jgi:hypothetical protein